MSSGVDTLDDPRNCPRSGEDLDLSVTPSSIVYLLQEATKLATPPSQHSLGPEGLKEETISISIPCSPDQKPQTLTPSFTSFSVLNDVQTSSPWEVMSLINLQCERLLHCGYMHGEEGDFYMCTTKTDGVEDLDNMECSSACLSEKDASTMCSGENPVEPDSTSGVCCPVPHIIDGTDHLSDPSVGEHNDGTKSEAIEDLAELISNSTADISDFSSASVMSEERSENGFLLDTSVVPLVETKDVDVNGAPPSRSPFHTQEGEMAEDSARSVAPQTPSPEISSVDFTSSLVDDKDGNPSFFFAFNSCEDPQSQSAVVSKSTPQPDCASLTKTDLNNNLDDGKLQEAEEALSALCSWGSRRRTPRKQAHPARSPDLQDSELQGVTFSMQTEMDYSTDQCRLLITSNYSELCRYGRRSRSSKSRPIQSSQRTSSSEEESDPSSLSKKICASCCTKKTPLWRDAEDGTPLCNACGIRYKKYRVRCLQCWNIPRKEANLNSKCLKCGDVLQLSSQNKHTGW